MKNYKSKLAENTTQVYYSQHCVVLSSDLDFNIS